jgi:hypothetical protein
VQPVARIRLLGEFQTAVAGIDVPSLGSTRLQSLLAYHHNANIPPDRSAAS